MAFSGDQITRLGLAGIPRGLYGSFAGKEPAPEPVPPVVVDRPQRGGFGGVPWSGTDYEERDRIAEQLRALYAGVVEDIEPESEDADEAAALVAEYAPTSAPDLPPADTVDWQAVVEDGRKSITRIRLALVAMERRVGAEARKRRDEEEAAAILLL